MMDLPVEFEEALARFPDDRRLKKIRRQYEAAWKSGKKTRPIIESFHDLLTNLTADDSDESAGYLSTA